MSQIIVYGVWPRIGSKLIRNWLWHGGVTQVEMDAALMDVGHRRKRIRFPDERARIRRVARDLILMASMTAMRCRTIYH